MSIETFQKQAQRTEQEEKERKGFFMLLEQAKDEMRNATTKEEALQIWKKYKPFQKVPKFYEIKEAKKKELSNQ